MARIPAAASRVRGRASDLPVRRGLRGGDVRARGRDARRRALLAEFRAGDVARRAAASLGAEADARASGGVAHARAGASERRPRLVGVPARGGASGRGLFGLLGRLEHDYTIGATSAIVGATPSPRCSSRNAASCSASPLALVVWTLWWDASEKAEGKRQKAKEGRRGDAASEVESRRCREEEGEGEGRRRSAAARRRRRGAREDDEAAADNSFAFCLLPFAFAADGRGGRGGGACCRWCTRIASW